MNQDIVHRMAEKKRVGILVGKQKCIEEVIVCAWRNVLVASQSGLFDCLEGKEVSPVSKLRFPTDGY